MNKDQQVSHIPAEWGGPFIWFRNDRGNVELISVASITETLTEVNEAIRARVAEVSS